MSREESIKEIADYYGFNHQCKKIVEEMGELTVEICKQDTKKIEEELADVLVLAMQLRLFLDNDRIESIIDYKINRQIGRMAKEINTYL